jgi:dTDP-4-amino-4,6-dideoxygalactose transaminase
MDNLKFTRAFVPPESIYFMTQAAQSDHLQGNGEFTKNCQDFFKRRHQCEAVFITPSCTHALELAFLSMGVGSGDEVVMPSFNFTSAATAVTLFGATPVFIDIELGTGNLDVELIETAITPRTKAICWVNYGGLQPDLREIRRIAQKHSLFTVEDNAHGVMQDTNSIWSDFPDVSTFSFHATKNIQCGEGGALILRNPELCEIMHFIQEKGTNRLDFTKGRVEKYGWVSKGSSYLLSELNAAFLWGQIVNFDRIVTARRSQFQQYEEFLLAIKGNHKFESLFVDTSNRTSAHFFPVITRNETLRDEIIRFFQMSSIELTSHYLPLHNSKGGLKFGKISPDGCENSIDFSRRILRFPLYSNPDSKIDRVLETLHRYLLEN